MSPKFKLTNLKINKKHFFLNFYNNYCLFSAREIIVKAIFFLIFTVPFIIDKVLKHYINFKSRGDKISVIPKIFDFSYNQNSGIAGGIFSDKNLAWLIITITFSIIFLVFIVFIFSKNITISLACLLLFTGGLDNLTDRLGYGYVVDYIVLLNSNFACNIGDGLIFGSILVLLVWSVGFFFVPEIKKVDVPPKKIL